MNKDTPVMIASMIAIAFMFGLIFAEWQYALMIPCPAATESATKGEHAQ